MLCLDASSPMTLHRNDFALAHHAHYHLVQHEPGDGLAVGGRRCRRLPEGWNILGETANGIPLRRAQGQRLPGQEPLVIRLDPDLRGQRFLPFPFQAAGDQPVLRLDSAILASGPVDLVAGTLQPLAPLPMKLPAFHFQIFGQLQTDLQ